jgi:hypothetical protein
MAVVAAIVLGGISCARTLPDQDRRIMSVVPGAKLSTDVLWKDFQADGPGATRRYHGQAVIVSGVVTRVDHAGPSATIFFASGKDRGILAHLLDDDAAAIAKSATPGDRLTLKCFCEGLDGNVVLKSCVKPG